MEAKDLMLDYFQIYDVDNQSVPRLVALRGQFDKEPVKNRVVFLDWFACCASKNGEPIFDKNAHLASYYLYPAAPEPAAYKVLLDNQFGRQEVLVGRPRALLMPAQKRERGSEFPSKLDHYKMYGVLEGKPIDKVVKLSDQFGTREARVTRPFGFAVPVRKEISGRVFPVYNQKAHLTIYYINPQETVKKVMILDQFNPRYRSVVMRRSFLLAVPSLKLQWGLIK